VDVSSGRKSRGEVNSKQKLKAAGGGGGGGSGVIVGDMIRISD
jgi:hypothetical protein